MNEADGNSGDLHFLLVGNGPYANRGCEAIVRGTMNILRRQFGERIRATVSSAAPQEFIEQQAANETDPGIQHIGKPKLRLAPVTGWSKAWLHRRWWGVGNRLLRLAGRQPNPAPLSLLGVESDSLDAAARDACLALQIGGDNYSLDYGLPTLRMKTDEFLWARSVPVVLWGASVGPFDAAGGLAPAIFDHLRRMQLILLREAKSQEYLRLHGVADNLGRMADPAFVMDAVEPPADRIGCRIAENCVGLNLSPMMAPYVTGGDMQAWEDLCVAMVDRVGADTGRDILLIPHVIEPWLVSNSDHALLKNVAQRCHQVMGRRVDCLGDGLSAAETKWVISQCAVFAGARTHSTIAAISSGVPTISLAYSLKAQGLNQDVFGTQEYCISPDRLSPAVLSERIRHVLDNSVEIRGHLSQRLPEIREAAFQGAALLRPVMDRSGR